MVNDIGRERTKVKARDRLTVMKRALTSERHDRIFPFEILLSPPLVVSIRNACVSSGTQLFIHLMNSDRV